MMSTGFYSIGVSGIAAAQMGMLATEHNVTNASTPGYTRQRTVQETNLATNTGSGAIGQGVNIATIERMYDRFLTAQVSSGQTKVSEIDAYYSQIKQIDTLLADPSAGLSPAIQDFFSGMQQVAANPSLASARNSMLSSADALVSRFQSLGSRLTELSDEVNGRIQDSVSTINTFSTQIAELNQKITISESTYGQPSNDLRDQRDQLLSNLNQLIKVSTMKNGDGSINVVFGTGQQLVTGSTAMTMTASPSSADSSKIGIGMKTAGGTLEMPESMIVGGLLGGLVRFRSESLSSSSNELGRLAASVALTFNAQNAQGQDLFGRANGDAGFNANFFSTSLMQPGVSANSNNSGTAVVSAAFVEPPNYGPEVNKGNFFTNLSTSDYQLKTTGGDSVAGYTYSLTRLSDNTRWPIAGGAPLTFNELSAAVQTSEGFSLSIASPAADAVGNSYLIQPTKNAANNLSINPSVAADPRMVAAALPFRTNSVSTNTGSGAISSGTGVPGFSSSLLPAGGINIAYSSAAPASLTFSGLTLGQRITYKSPGDQSETVYPDPTLYPDYTVSWPAAISIPYSQGMAFSASGMSVIMTGQPNNGDSFEIVRNTSGTADGRNALALSALQTQSTVGGGSATLQTAYAEMVGQIGTKARELAVSGKGQQAVLDQAIASKDALSGVNLDEEAANMIRFQQAYQASAKILEMGKTLFDTILQIG